MKLLESIVRKTQKTPPIASSPEPPVKLEKHYPIRLLPKKESPKMVDAEVQTNMFLYDDAVSMIQNVQNRELQTGEAATVDASTCLADMADFATNGIELVDWGGTTQQETNSFGCQTFDHSFGAALTQSFESQTESFYDVSQFAKDFIGQTTNLLETSGTQTEFPTWFDEHTQTDSGLDLTFI